MINKFEIGDEVRVNGLWPIVEGKISAILHPICNDIFVNIYKRDLSVWSNKYPDWINKTSYYIVYSTPFRPITLEEFRLSELKKGFNHTEQSLLTAYEVNIPMQVMTHTPEDAIESISNTITNARGAM